MLRDRRDGAIEPEERQKEKEEKQRNVGNSVFKAGGEQSSREPHLNHCARTYIYIYIRAPIAAGGGARSIFCVR